MLAKGLPILVDAEILSRDFGEDFEKTSTAQKICVLIPRLIPEHTLDTPLWSLVTECLSTIKGAGAPAGLGDVLVPAFLLKFLHLHGMQPELERCMGCGKPIVPSGAVLFSRIRGGVVETGCMTDTEAGISLDVRVIAALLYMKSATFNEIIESSPSVFQGTREVIDEFARWHLGISTAHTV